MDSDVRSTTASNTSQDTKPVDNGFNALDQSILEDALSNGPNHKIYATMLLRKWGFLAIPIDPLTLMQAAAIACAGKKSAVAVELGSAQGVTSARMSEFLAYIGVEQLEYFCIDNLCLGFAHSAEYPAKLKFIKGDRKILSDLPSVNFGFIDACHCSECVHKDSIAMSRKIVSGGGMAFHDTSTCGQFPTSGIPVKHWQISDSHGPRPLAVLEGLASARPLWDGDWNLIFQRGDWFPWGGVRAYQKI